MTRNLMKTTAPALNVVDGTPTVSSLDVARHFGKRHERVLDAARTLIAELPDAAQHNFVLSEYRDATGRALPSYRMTRDGFTLLAMGFTGPQALKFKLAYIDAFNRMEAELSRRYVAPLSNDKQFRNGVPMHLKFKLQEQGRKIMGLLVRTPHPAEQRNLYWQLRQVNDALGIPTESMETMGIPTPALPAPEGGSA